MFPNKISFQVFGAIFSNKNVEYDIMWIIVLTVYMFAEFDL